MDAPNPASAPSEDRGGAVRPADERPALASESRPTPGSGRDRLRPRFSILPRNKPIPAPGGFLASMRIRKKLIVLHTIFSLVLAGVLASTLWPAGLALVREAESEHARLTLKLAARDVAGAPGRDHDAVLTALTAELPAGVSIQRLPAGAVSPVLYQARLEGSTRLGLDELGTTTAITLVPDPGTSEPLGLVAKARLSSARAAVTRALVVLVVALLGVYALIAVSLEAFVLPRNVYGPLRRILLADRAVQENDRARELIEPAAMPADELGEIMRSRNAAIEALRSQEAQLAAAASQLEEALNDVRRKNHLLETARSKLADADRLASLGIMSAGLAHELNTPLAVIKGLGEKLSSSGGVLPEAEAQLLVRVTARLERLSESLLDFARVRPPVASPTNLHALVNEAWTLVALDRAAAGGMALDNRVPTDATASCDADRMLQVLVNLLRNAADAMNDPQPTGAVKGAGSAGPLNGAGGDARPPGLARAARGTISVACAPAERDGRSWISLTIRDEGPGIDPGVAGRLFEPFASTRLDARGTGLGLAVSEGIVREHGGLLLARNRADGHGAEFEVVLPKS